MDALDRFSRLALALQRGAHAMPAEGFVGWTLEQLRAELPYDAAVWGYGHVLGRTMVVHHSDTVGLPAQFMADYAQVQPHDSLQFDSVARQGRTVAAAAADAPPQLTVFLDRYGLRHALSTIDVDPLTALLDCVAVYRFDAACPFAEDERRFMQSAFAHLSEAWTRNRLLHLLQAGAPRHAGPWRAAAADRTGLLHHADADFARLLRREWPDWTGPQLPALLTRAIAATGPQRVSGREVVFKIVPLADLTVVQAREASEVDLLTVREREIASYVAQGHNHKQIARLLELAPTTVRNHLATAYRRLGINSKAQLAALVHRHE